MNPEVATPVTPEVSPYSPPSCTTASVEGFVAFGDSVPAGCKWWSKTDLTVQRLLYADCCIAELPPGEYLAAAADWGSGLDVLAESPDQASDRAALVERLWGQPVTIPQTPEPTTAEVRRLESMAKLWTKYESACGEYAKASSKGALTAGKWAHAWLVKRLDGLTDLGDRRTTRAQGIKRLQGQLDDAFGGVRVPDVDDCVRLWAVCEVYLGGDANAAGKLGVGQLRQFAPSLDRNKASETWSHAPGIDASQKASLETLLRSLVSGSQVLTAADTEMAVRRLMGKPTTEKAKDGTVTTTTPSADGTTTVQVTKPDGGQVVTKHAADGSVVTTETTAPKPAAKPAAGSSATDTGTRATGDTKAPAGHVPEVSPESPVECAKRIVALLRGRPDASIVLRMVGTDYPWTADTVVGLLTGIMEAGRMECVLAAAQFGVKAHATAAKKSA